MKPEEYNTVKWMNAMEKITGLEKKLGDTQDSLNLCLLIDAILLIAIIFK